LAPAAIAAALLLATPVPDLLISGDGRHVGIAGEDERLLVLRETRSEFTRDNLLELAGMVGEPVPLAELAGGAMQPGFLRDRARARRGAMAGADEPQPPADRGARARRGLRARGRGRRRALAAGELPPPLAQGRRAHAGRSAAGSRSCSTGSRSRPWPTGRAAMAGGEGLARRD
jgi:hypothetical protein